jgi:UV DNA damage endonuclease
VRELEWQARLVSELDPEQGVIVLHVGGAYGDKDKAIDRFAEHYHRYLSDTAKSRLTVENDDVTFTLDDVLSVHEMTSSPIIFDILHHKANHTGDDWTESLLPKLERVVASWRGKVPKTHLSSPKAGSKTTHADYIEQPDFEELLYWMGQFRPGEPFDLMIEAKLKDKAVQALSCELFNPPGMVALADSGA